MKCPHCGCAYLDPQLGGMFKCLNCAAVFSPKPSHKAEIQQLQAEITELEAEDAQP